MNHSFEKEEGEGEREEEGEEEGEEESRGSREILMKVKNKGGLRGGNKICICFRWDGNSFI